MKESPVPGSPALMPKLPKPLPARSLHPLSQGQDAMTQVLPTGPGPDQAHSSKRKLNLEVQVGGVVEGITNTGAVDPCDTGVKVIGKNDENHSAVLSRFLAGFHPYFAPFAHISPCDSYQVIVRLRPLNKKEEAEEATHVVQKVSSNSVSLGDQQFTYDAVAGEAESQVCRKICIWDTQLHLVITFAQFSQWNLCD